LLASGQLDESFATGAHLTTSLTSNGQHPPVALDQDNHLYLASTSQNDVLVQKFLNTGVVDQSFGDNGTARFACCDTAREPRITVDSHNNVVIAVDTGPEFPENGQTVQTALARFTPDGQTDSEFGVNGVVVNEYQSSGQLLSLTSDDNGKVLLISRLFHSYGYMQSKTDKGFAVRRYNPDGQLDSTFSDDGILPLSRAFSSNITGDLLIENDGFSLLSWGDQIQPVLSRFSDNDLPDTQTAVVQNNQHIQADSSTSTALQFDPQGQLVLSGTTIRNSVGDNAFIAKFDAQGQADLSYGQGTTTSRAGGELLAIDSQGNYLVKGRVSYAAFDSDFGGLRYLTDTPLLRYDRSGNIDLSFADNGVLFVHLDSDIEALEYTVTFDRQDKLLISAGDHLYRYNPRWHAGQ
jgi:uncharacterized delta-60 repeat protein